MAQTRDERKTTEFYHTTKSSRTGHERVGSKPGWAEVRKRTSSRLSCDYVGLRNIMFDGSLGAIQISNVLCLFFFAATKTVDLTRPMIEGNTILMML